MCLRGHRSSVHRPIPACVDLAYSEGRLMPSCSLFYCRWCYPAVQHLTASAGGGGKGIPSSPGKKIACTLFEMSIT